MIAFTRDIEDERGDIVDREFWCSRCHPAEVLPWPCYDWPRDDEGGYDPVFCDDCGSRVDPGGE